MGQKVSPIGMRIGINKTWESKWFADNSNFAKYLDNDNKIRKYLAGKVKDAAVSSILIDRNNDKTEITINTAKPGVIMGHEGKEIEKIKKELTKLVKENIQISIMEVKNPDLVAALVAENIAHQIENRVSFRIAQKRAIRNTMKAGAKGIKTAVSGRLGGADTTYGKIGVKVWIYKGEILPEKKTEGGKKNGSHTKKN